jgi:hypothetical protein
VDRAKELANLIEWCEKTPVMSLQLKKHGEWIKNEIADAIIANGLVATKEKAEKELREIDFAKLAPVPIVYSGGGYRGPHPSPVVPLPYEDRRYRFACKICGNVPSEDGNLEHAKGCYSQSENGGGTEFIDAVLRSVEGTHTV